MMNRRGQNVNYRIRSIAPAVAQILALCALVFPGSAAEHTLIHAGYGGIAGYQLPLWVNKEAGISRKYGIELETLLISGGSLNMQALLAGSIQMSQNSASAAVQSALRGAPVSLVATLENRMPLQIEAIHYVRTNKDGSIKALKKYLRVDDMESVAATYDFFSQRIESIPRPNLDGLRNILREMDAPQRNPQEFVDTTLLDEIEKEGFLQKPR
jgi:hypothetical protein